MKSAIILCLFAVVAMVFARPEEHYTDRYDSVDLDEILANKRLLSPYINCVLDLGKCTPDGKELKSHIREALVEDCAKCTPTQRRGTERVITHLIKYEPKSWSDLKAKYDSTGQYSKKYEDNLKNIKA